MEKIEVLLKKDLSCNFDTPKKLNRSNLAISQQVIDDLESGVFTCEAIDELSARFPIFKYRTCITIHGNWPEISRTRIGGYKNVHQNKNGSVEVRYSAIDAGKVKRVARGLKCISDCKFRYQETSNERGFYWMYPIKTKEDILQAQTIMKPIAEKLTGLKIYGHVSLFTARDFFQTYLVLALIPLALPENMVDALILTLTETDAQTYADKFVSWQIDQDQQERETKERYAQWAREQVDKKKALEARAVELLPAIAHLKECNDITAGTLVKIVISNEKPVFIYVRKNGAGAFGRIKWQKAFSDSFTNDLNVLVWKDCKQQSISELSLKNYRLFSPLKKAA